MILYVKSALTKAKLIIQEQSSQNQVISKNKELSSREAAIRVKEEELRAREMQLNERESQLNAFAKQLETEKNCIESLRQPNHDYDGQDMMVMDDDCHFQPHVEEKPIKSAPVQPTAAGFYIHCDNAFITEKKPAGPGAAQKAQDIITSRPLALKGE